MGHKVQPTGFRLGITEEWRSRWYADKNYAETLGNDLAIRSYLEKRLAKAALSRVDIERAGDKVKVTIRFRGREMAHTNVGYGIHERFAAACSEIANIEKPAKLEGRQMIMFLAPKKQ